MRIPVATYRLQFHAGWTLRQATELLPYLQDLGISHVYASPLLQARRGSIHGYDVIDPERINSEIGTDSDLQAFVEALHQRGMGLVLDIVPNHMAATLENFRWRDVLKFGPRSRFSDWFDIDWNSPDPELHGKVLVPVLSTDLVSAVKAGQVRAIQVKGELAIEYGADPYPVRPETSPKSTNDLNADPERLLRLLEQQHYLLAPWREADARINYRRFFSINELAGVRVELPQVFDEVHSRVLEWYCNGFVDGFRVDHPDGLADPIGYLERLRDAAPEAWIVVEKILERGESLGPTWPVAGTTGYEFLARVLGLFIDSSNRNTLTDFYEKFTDRTADYAAMVRARKRWILEHSLAADVERLVRVLQSIARTGVRSEIDATTLRETLIDLIASYPVYRTYFRNGKQANDPVDRHWLDEAVAEFRKHRASNSPDLSGWMSGLLSDDLDSSDAAALIRDFRSRFQQLTGPAMAKGVEDTLFYCFNPFIALNEVGASPAVFGDTVEEFHRRAAEALVRWPNAMLATSTHDTKRSEDVRARLAVLSEIPDQWKSAVRGWSEKNQRHRQGTWPERNAEYLFYQTLVGAWPLTTERAVEYMTKAAREAKEHTSWTEPSESYESALTGFVREAMADPEFATDVERFVRLIERTGRVNSLAQTILKLTAPGVPDIYQGTELWDHSLVDPDNRRPVDFERRRELLRNIQMQSVAAPSLALELLAGTEGGIKLYLIHRTLGWRQRQPQVLARGSYEPLAIEGAHAKHVCAFARRFEDAMAMVVVPRLTHSLVTQFRKDFPVGDEVWQDTRICLPRNLNRNGFRNLFTGEIHTVIRDQPGIVLGLADVFRTFPVAVLEFLPDRMVAGS